ncbi:MAG: PQQ-binding-like beta-propeller repeat protein [Elusimicrobiota bacterium]
MNSLKTTFLIFRRIFFLYFLLPSSVFLLFFFLLTSVFHLPSSNLYAASWPVFRASADRSGMLIEQAEPGGEDGLESPWSFMYRETASSAFRVSGNIVSSPVVYKGIVYFGARDGSVWALDTATGEQVWQYGTDDWVDATPCVSTDTVYVPSTDKNLYAFDRLTGDIRWQTYTGSIDSSSPVLYGGKLYFLSGSPEKKLYEVDAKSGQILNGYSISQFGFSSPSVKNNLMFFGTNDGQFHCFDLAAKKIKWSRQTEGGIYYSTLVAGATAVYAVSGEDERKLFCLDPNNDGDVIWQSVDLNNKRAAVSSVSLSEDKVFVASSSGTALAIFAFPLTNPSPGQPVQPLWSKRIGVPHPVGVVSSPAIADGVVYIGSGDGNLYCLRTSDGWFFNNNTKAYQEAPVGYYLSYQGSVSSGIVSSPAVSNGMVFVGTYDGQFYGFKADKITSIASPDNTEIVVKQSQITGTVANPSFTGFKLEYGAGASPSQWIEISTGSVEVEDGLLGDWNAAGLADGTYSLKLTVNGTDANRAINRVTVDNPPMAPSNLKAEDTPFDGGGSLTLSWNRSADDGAGDNDVAAYRIYKSTFEGGYAYLAQVSAPATSYMDSACPAQTTYYFSVKSVDAHSESSYSGPAGGFSIVDGVEIQPETGGTVTFNYAGTVTEVVIEPNTFTSKVWIGIRIPPDPPNTGKPGNSKDTNIVREFGITPADAVFLKNVMLKIPYMLQDISGMNKENLRIYWWDDAKKQWRIVNSSDPGSEDGRVWASVPHFSLYRIMEYSPGLEELLTEDNTYTYPNPAKGDKLYFKFYLGSKADVIIDVYNVAGELITHLEKNSCPAGIVSELEWNIGSIASGVYVYRVEAKTPSASKSFKKKLAIIH